MNMKASILLYIYAFLMTFNSFIQAGIEVDPPMHLHLFTDEQASHHGCRCLDGSPSGYYYRPGTNITSWFISLETVLESCYSTQSCNDSFGYYNHVYATSKNWADEIYFNHGMRDDWLFASDFKTWHHVNILGCSGDLFSGQSRAKVNGVYFAGHLTINAVISDLLNTTNFASATRVLIYGKQGGGVAVFEHADYFSETIHWAEVKAVAVGGFAYPLNFTKYSDWLEGKMETPINRSMYYLYNSYINKECRKANKDKPYLCGPGNVGFLYPYVQTPIYVVQNLYDCEQLHFRLGVPYQVDSNVTRYMNYYGAMVRNTLHQVLPQYVKGDGVFSPCYYGYYSYFVTPLARLAKDGIDVKTYLEDWYFNHHSKEWNLLDYCPVIPIRDCYLPN